MTSWRGSKTRITWSTSSGPANILYSQKQIGRMVCRVSRRGRAMKCNTKLQEVKICNLVNKTNLVQQVGFIYKIIQRCMVNKTKQKKKLKMCIPVFSHIQYLLFCTHRYFVQPYGRTLNCAVTHSSVNGTDHDQLY